MDSKQILIVLISALLFIIPVLSVEIFSIRQIEGETNYVEVDNNTVKGVVEYNESYIKLKNDESGSSEGKDSTSIPTTTSPWYSNPPTTATEKDKDKETIPGWRGLTTGRLVLMLVVSFSIPIAFMALLFWRLRKEKKHLNAAGALVYRETIIVPTYNTDNSDSNGSNVNQMHPVLYDTPPEYDVVIKSPVHHFMEKEKLPDQSNAEDAPPPEYSTVHL